MVQTLFAGFQQPLPWFPNNGGVGDASASGQATEAADPPRFSVKRPATDWMNYGMPIYAATRNSLSSQYLCEVEDSILHSTEADIVRAASLYLIHPVNQALCALPQFSKTFYTHSECVVSNVRSDLTYYKVTANPGCEARAFAIVEYKARGVLDLGQFIEGQKSVTSRQPAKYWASKAMERGDESFYKGTSMRLMKQCVAYATSFATQYVVLYNWEVMVLIRFHLMDPRKDKTDLVDEGGGEYCETTVIDCRRSSGQVRLALLGFLSEAYKNTPP